MGRLHLVDVLLGSLDLYQIARLQALGDWPGLTNLMIAAAKVFEVAGAGYLLLEPSELSCIVLTPRSCIDAMR